MKKCDWGMKSKNAIDAQKVRLVREIKSKIESK